MPVSQSVARSLRCFSRLFLCAVCAFAPISNADQNDSVGGEPSLSIEGSRPRVYALFSALGDRLTYVQNVRETQTRFAPYVRSTLQMTDHMLNTVVLKSMDEAIAAVQPRSVRRYYALEPRGMADADPAQRDQRALQAVLLTAKSMPERSTWDEIIVVTPAYAATESDGMASRLHGVGVYVHPLKSERLILGASGGGPSTGGSGAMAERIVDPEAGGVMKERVYTPKGEEHRARQYIAVYYYARIRRYDAKTMELLSEVNRRESLKYNDPESTAGNFAQSIPAEFLARRMTALTHDSTVSGMRQALGVVTVGPLEFIDDVPPVSPSAIPAGGPQQSHAR